MIWKLWYTLPNGKCWNFTSRSGSSSLGLMCVKAMYPERLPDPAPTSGDAHRLLDFQIGSTLPAGCAVMVRNPVERFQSLLGRWTGVEVDDALAHIAWGLGKGTASTAGRASLESCTQIMLHHYQPVSYFAQSDSQLFKFPDIRGMADYLGVTVDVEHINQSESHRDLTPEQETRVREIYAEDIALWESLP